MPRIAAFFDINGAKNAHVMAKRRSRCGADGGLSGLLGPCRWQWRHCRQRRLGFGNGIKRVLLISIDGMHALDFINCSQGISGVNGGTPYCPTLAELAGTGVNYLEASASKPSNSFPGLMALVSGGSPRTVGAFYDVAYDRVLAPPATTTGNGVAGAGSLHAQGSAEWHDDRNSRRALISTSPS